MIVNFRLFEIVDISLYFIIGGFEILCPCSIRKPGVSICFNAVEINLKKNKGCFLKTSTLYIITLQNGDKIGEKVMFVNSIRELQQPTQTDGEKVFEDCLK